MSAGACSTGTLIAAVADGVSAAPRSDLGAALAVRYATAAVARQLDDGAIDWLGVFEQAAWALRLGGGSCRARTPARSPPRCWWRPYRRAIRTRSRCEVAAVGDSPAFRLRGRNYDLVVGASSAGRRADRWRRRGAAPRRADRRKSAPAHSSRGEALLLCTDGVALPLAGGTGELGRTLARELATPPDVVDFARLLDFSRSTYDDDRTLIAVWAP